MDLIRQLAQELNIRAAQAEAAVRLIDEGNTIPFIARYRKEVTGSLNDEVLRALDERLKYLRNLEERKSAVLASIEEQGKLTGELKAAIEAAQTLVAVEDLYLPFRPKRRTRAMIAREKGLGPLAEMLFAQDTDQTPETLAAAFLSEEVPTAGEALAGASDIIAEQVADMAALRSAIRNAARQHGEIVSAAGKEKDEDGVYEIYRDFHEPVLSCPGYRVLAMDRGEAEKKLSVRIEAPQEQILYAMKKQLVRTAQPECRAFLEDAVTDSYRRLIAPAVERELRSELTEKAQDGAIRVFGQNLRQLLMQPPIAGHTVLGWDPAFRTGCKLAVVDPTGKVLDTRVIYPTAPQNKVEESKRTLKALIQKYGITLISLGNGTASRESEQVIAGLINEVAAETGGKLQYVIVSEAGASVYSASKLASEEFPEFDVGQRSAASIARRLQDPLSELVKIDPKSIGVGQYQHDMDQKKLGEALGAVVEDCVNSVGVDLNTASASLLEYVSGVTKTVAKNIVEYRGTNGRFTSRRELLKVPKLGPKAFEQCAGFLRIRGGSEPLDSTGVHPESYAAAGGLLKKLGYDAGRLSGGGIPGISGQIRDYRTLAEELGIGEPTLRDIAAELEKPGRDPREEMPRPILKSDVLEMKDLKEGMVLRGTVRNVIDFGAFVDIGVHQDGLVHISQMADKYIRHPLEVVQIGDVVDVRVLSVDLQRKRIGLSMKL